DLVTKGRLFDGERKREINRLFVKNRLLVKPVDELNLLFVVVQDDFGLDRGGVQSAGLIRQGLAERRPAAAHHSAVTRLADRELCEGQRLAKVDELRGGLITSRDVDVLVQEIRAGDVDEFPVELLIEEAFDGTL